MYKVNMKAARINAGFNRQQAAKELGVTTKTLFNWENKITSPKIETVKKICKLYAIPIEFLEI